LIADLAMAPFGTARSYSAAMASSLLEASLFGSRLIFCDRLHCLNLRQPDHLHVRLLN